MDALTLTDHLNDGDDGIIKLRTSKDFKSLFPKTKNKFISEVLKFVSKNGEIKREFSNSGDLYIEVKHKDVDFTMYSTNGTFQYVVNIIAEALGQEYQDTEDLIFDTYEFSGPELTFELVDFIYNDEHLTTNIAISLFVKYCNSKDKDQLLSALLQLSQNN